MKKIIIYENQKGFLFQNGVLTKLLSAGKYFTTKNKKIEVVDLHARVVSAHCSPEILLANESVKKAVTTIEVGDNQLALHFIGGRYTGTVTKGKHAFWNEFGEHTFVIADTSTPIVDESIPRYVLEKINSAFLTKVNVSEHQKALLYFNNRLHAVLDAGTYFYWNTGAEIKTTYVDTRMTQINLAGQELLTADKVTLRINFVCNYRITDCVKIFTEIDDYKEQLYVSAQLALREYVGKYKLDELLENKDKLSQYVFDRLKTKEKSLYMEIIDAGVKDIILPGEIRDIMNTVLIAEKQAQANVITRREEVASTRSLLNTAKLMDENQTLYKLKELEFIERICANVGNINVSGNMLTQLTEVLRGNT